MSPWRNYLAAGILVGLLAAAARESVHTLTAQPEPGSGGRQAAAFSLNGFVFTFQAKILIGSLAALSSLGPASASTSAAMVSQFAGTWLNPRSPDAMKAGATQPDEPDILLKKFILAKHFKLDQRAAAVESSLEKHGPGTDREILDLAAVLRSSYQAEAAARGRGLRFPPPVNPETSRRLSSALGWFGDLAAADLNGTVFPGQGGGPRDPYAAARHAYRRALQMGLVLILSLLIGSGCAAVFLGLTWTGRLPARFVPLVIPGTYAAEIFTGYLACMTLFGWLASRVEPSLARVPILGRLAINAAFIPLLCGWLAWPKAFGEPFRKIFDSIGLALKSGRAWLSEVGFGLLGYCAAIPLVLGAALLTSLVAARLGVDMERGMHPLVPVLMFSRDWAVLGLALGLMIVVAPIVEEIMFRGVLYGWLRLRLGRWSAMALSAFIFALIHPQGAIGLLPIFAIACVLAFMREWRQSLLASMVTHLCFNATTFILIRLLLSAGKPMDPGTLLPIAAFWLRWF